MAIYEALLEAERGEDTPGSIQKAMLDKYAYLEKQQRAFMHFMYEGVIDKKITLDYVIDSVSSVPVKKMKKPVKCLLRMGVYQILYMDSVPDSAACNETVKIAKKKHLNNLSGFINGVLRTVSREGKGIAYPDKKKDVLSYLSVAYSMPKLIIESLINDYGQKKAEGILKNLLSERPLMGRSMISACSTDELLHKLNGKEGIKAQRIDGLEAFKLQELDALTDMEEFNEGLFTIQDISSQLVCRIAGIKKNDMILDVCASPGGKTMHAADILKSLGSDRGCVTACDVSEIKTEKILENVRRCHLDNVMVKVSDATVLRPEDTEKYDIVLCDVPCSGFGVMGRKRDIKYGITVEGLKSLDRLQTDIINNAVTYVKKGGVFIYSTCTMRKAENDEKFKYIKNVLNLEPVDFYDELPKALKKESAHDGFLQLFAGENDTDGFFIAKFHTRA